MKYKIPEERGIHLRNNATQIRKGKVYRIPGTTTTIEKTSWGAFLVRDENGNEIGKRSTRKAALRLAQKHGLAENPSVGEHTDLFEGTSPLYVPMDRLSKAELEELSWDAFNDDEWDELDDEIKETILSKMSRGEIEDSDLDWGDLDNDMQKAVYDNNSEDLERAHRVASFLHDQYAWTQNKEDRDLHTDQEYFEMWLADHTHDNGLFEAVERKQEDELGELVEYFQNRGYSDEQIESAVNAQLEDVSNWDVDIEESTGYYPSNHVYESHELTSSIYFEKGFLIDEADPQYKSDIEQALRVMGEDYDVYPHGSDAKDYFDVNELWDIASKDRHWGVYETGEIESGLAVVADPDWDMLRQGVAEDLGEEEPEALVVASRDAENVVYEFGDGGYVLELTPAQMRAEGRIQKHCIKDRSMGYLGAVESGQAKAYSIRDANGKIQLTMFVELNHNGRPKHVPQLKGKVNRKPGTNDIHGQIGKRFKKAEVDNSIEFLRHLGLDPEDVIDLKPALHYMETGEKKRWAKHNPGGCARCRSLGGGFCSPLESGLDDLAENPEDEDPFVGRMEGNPRDTPILDRFYADTIDAGELRGIDPDVIQHAIAMGWIVFSGRKAHITEAGKEERDGRENPPRHYEASLTAKGQKMLEDIERIAKRDVRYRGREADVAYETVLSRARAGVKGLVR